MNTQTNTLESIASTGFMILTPNYMLRTKQALTETRLALSKELRYSADLRKHDRVAYLESHIVKLETAIIEGKIKIG